MSAGSDSTAEAGLPPRPAMGRTRWIGFKTIVMRELDRILRIWAQTIVPSAVTATLYFLIFGSLIGRRIGEMGGVPYTQYIAPGLIMMAVITNAYANTVSSFFGAKMQRFLEEISVSPQPSWVVVLGYVGGGVLRGLLVGAVVTVVSLFFTHLPVHHLFIIVAAVFITSFVFAVGGFINGVFAKTFDQVNWMPAFVLTPLTYFGGVFYSVSLLPEWAQTLSLANPILHMVNAFRYGFLGSSDVDIGVAFLMMGGFALVLFWLAIWLMERGIGMRE
ncbi:MAG: ABC transporter permease [Steroidobacteraceae bacterium]